MEIEEGVEAEEGVLVEEAASEEGVLPGAEAQGRKAPQSRPEARLTQATPLRLCDQTRPAPRTADVGSNRRRARGAPPTPPSTEERCFLDRSGRSSLVAAPERGGRGEAKSAAGAAAKIVERREATNASPPSSANFLSFDVIVHTGGGHLNQWA